MQSAYERTVTEPPGNEKEGSLDTRGKITEKLPLPNNTDRKTGNLRTDCCSFTNGQCKRLWAKYF